MLDEEIHPRRGGDEMKDFEVIQVGNVVCKERISESRGSFQLGVACCLRIKWWAIALSAALMRK